MNNLLFNIIDSDGAYLDCGLEYDKAAQALLTLDDHDFDFLERPDGLLELVWGPQGMLRSTGIQAAARPDILLRVVSRNEPWNGRRATLAESWRPSWWRIEQPGRPPFYGWGHEAEAYAYCQCLDRWLCDRGEAAFDVHEVAHEEFQQASRSSLAQVELAAALRDRRTVFPIDDQLPVVLRDLCYPDRLFELTSKVFLLLNVNTQNGLVSGRAYLRVRIDEDYIRWDEADWRAVIESAIRRAEDTHSGCHSDQDDPATTVAVSLATTWGQDILLWRRTEGVVEDNIEIDLRRLRTEICHQIASVPESGQTNCLCQSAVSANGNIEIKCKRRGLDLLSRRPVARH
jgi:hypothetical protein